MSILLPLLFLVALPPEPVVHLPPPAEIRLILDAHERWVESHPEGWQKVFAIPDSSEVTTIEVPASNNIYRGMGNGASEVEQWRSLVQGQFPPEQVENALCVIRSESGGNALAKNPNSNARGIFQIMTSVWGPHFGFSHEDFYEPGLNTYAAARIWESSGWGPWSPRTRRNCGL